MAKIDFKKLATESIPALESILPRLCPAGRFDGGYFKVGGVDGSAGNSLAVDLQNGIWKDYANADHAGGDVISFCAAVRNVNQADAAAIIAEMIGSVPASEMERARNKPPAAKWTPMLCPVEAEGWRPVHGDHGSPSRVWDYRNAQGRLIGRVSRFDLPDGSKEILPCCFAKGDGGRSGWRWMAFEKPRPIYNLVEIAAKPDLPVLVVEGEKTADAAKALFPDFVVTTWPGGSKAVKFVDLIPLTGRKVLLWPDNDEAGYGAMFGYEDNHGRRVKGLSDYLAELRCKVRCIKPPDDLGPGWDLADAKDWTPEDAARNLTLWATKTPPALATKPTPEAEPVPEKEKAQPGANRFFQILGYDRERYYYYSNSARLVLPLPPGGHSDANLLRLAPITYWETTYPRRGGRGMKVNYANMLDSHYRTAHEVGVYDPGRIRGRGAWFDGGRSVVHLGDKLIVDGKETALADFRSDNIYERRPRLDVTLADPISDAEGRSVLEFFEMLPFETQIDARLALGWCAAAIICGALDWRPHIWVTGPSGSGKSWVYKYVLGTMLGRWALKVVGGMSSEAGVRGSLMHDALPVIQEESADSESKISQQRQIAMIELIRQSSSETGAKIVKGTSDGGAVATEVRAAFALVAIGISLSNHADIGRITPITLRKPTEDKIKAEAEFTAIKVRREKLLTPAFVSRFHARVISMIPTIRANAEIFAVAGAKVLGSRRIGDQLGTMLSAAHAVVSADRVTDDYAEKWIGDKKLGLSVQIDNDVDDHHQALARILSIPLEVFGLGRFNTYHAGALILIASGHVKDDAVTIPEAVRALENLGIKVYDAWFGLRMGSEEIARKLRETPWEKSWPQLLQRIDNAYLSERLRWGNGVRAKGVMVPLEELTAD